MGVFLSGFRNLLVRTLALVCRRRRLALAQTPVRPTAERPSAPCSPWTAPLLLDDRLELAHRLEHAPHRSER
jgi:hypothetical protein